MKPTDFLLLIEFPLGQSSAAQMIYVRIWNQALRTNLFIETYRNAIVSSHYQINEYDSAFAEMFDDYQIFGIIGA